MKRISVLGSTGSVGLNTLEIIKKFPDRFLVDSLACNTSIDRLAVQINEFRPKIVAVCNEDVAVGLEKLLYLNSSKANPKIVTGGSAYKEIVSLPSTDMVVNAIVGSAGLLPTVDALNSGKNVALANKESLVMAGRIIISLATQNNVNLIPIDSEHSAIYQCLLGNNRSDLKKLILTASGGPFLNLSQRLFSEIRTEDALKHPNWIMGNKITVDSATMMNKVLEVIEAKWFFDVAMDEIEILIHSQSIIHSMVSYKDGTVMCNMGVPDMKLAIAYALSFPDRLDIGIDPPNFSGISNLSFEEPNLNKFPCLKFTYTSFEIGEASAVVLNASNEVAVQAFLNNKIHFTDIYSVIKHGMDKYQPIKIKSLMDVLTIDHWSRKVATNFVHEKLKKINL